MKNKKKLPKGLVEKQELQRQETTNKVLRACADIKNEGMKVTISALVEYTGLARSTLAKPHIRELLAKHGDVTDDGTSIAKRKKARQAEAIVEKDRQIKELRMRNSALELECEVLRGKIFLLMN